MEVTTRDVGVGGQLQAWLQARNPAMAAAAVAVATRTLSCADAVYTAHVQHNVVLLWPEALPE